MNWTRQSDGLFRSECGRFDLVKTEEGWMVIDADEGVIVKFATKAAGEEWTAKQTAKRKGCAPCKPSRK